MLKKSFYFRTHTEWNALPKEIRQNSNPSTFKEAITKYFWNSILNDYNENLDFGEFHLIDNG